jgi:hypothetical protein
MISYRLCSDFAAFPQLLRCVCKTIALFFAYGAIAQRLRFVSKEIAMQLRCDCVAIVLCLKALRCDNAAIALQLRCKCAAIALRFQSNCAAIALQLRCVFKAITLQLR